MSVTRHSNSRPCFFKTRSDFTWAGFHLAELLSRVEGLSLDTDPTANLYLQEKVL